MRAGSSGPSAAHPVKKRRLEAAEARARRRKITSDPHGALLPPQSPAAMLLARLVTLVLVAISVSPATESSVMPTAPAVVAGVTDAPLPPGSASVDGPASASASLYQPLDPSLSGPLQFLLKVSMRRWRRVQPYSATPSISLTNDYPDWPNGTRGAEVSLC